MDKRRGGCAPNIAYTLALLGEKPYLMGTAGEDFGDYKQWLEAAGIDTSLCKQVNGKFTASFFCSTDTVEQPDRVVLHRRDVRRRPAVLPQRQGHEARDHLAERSGGDDLRTPRSAGR